MAQVCRGYRANSAAPQNSGHAPADHGIRAAKWSRYAREELEIADQERIKGLHLYMRMGGWPRTAKYSKRHPEAMGSLLSPEVQASRLSNHSLAKSRAIPRCLRVTSRERKASRRVEIEPHHDLLGLGLGLIPLVPVLLSELANAPLRGVFAGLVLYSIEVLATIATMSIKRVRTVGYGYLTMVLISPLVFLMGLWLDLALYPIYPIIVIDF